ncbi:MAG: LacI family DNA-binding transcriptional regulator [Actinomycetota bacterium]|nr:LacI family DNA-binding transcriptional regulator [Actinomycetota bacterium]
MPRDAVTLREVAKAAGVHPGTASRALNESTRSLVRAETVERVSVAARALGYKPNMLARSFKTRRTNSVGVVIPDINNPLFPPMVRGVEGRLFEDGYVALLANTENDPDRQHRIFEGMVDRRVDGMILATAHRHDVAVAELAEAGMPVVLLNRVVEGGGFSSVSVDDAQGIRKVVEHLRSLGHVRIAHIAGPQSMSTGHARHQSFLSSMEETGAAADPRLVMFAQAFSISEGERCATRLLAGSERPSAIVAANDMLALGCYSATERAGLVCPADISIVGFNDMPFIDRLNPPLTTVRIPHHELGVHAAELLLAQLHDPDAPIAIVEIVPELITRGSTAPARVPTAAP